MPMRKSITHRMDMITASSPSNDSDNHKSLGVDQEQTLKTKASTTLRGSPFIVGSIYLEVLGLVEEQYFNVSLFFLCINKLIIFEKLFSINK